MDDRKELAADLYFVAEYASALQQDILDGKALSKTAEVYLARAIVLLRRVEKRWRSLERKADRE